MNMKMLLRLTASAALAVSTSGYVSFGQNYTQTNLVSNLTGVAPVTDPALVNPWGLSRSSSSDWWVSDNQTGLSTLYNGAGVKKSLIVTIPAATPGQSGAPATGNPTGTIFNGSMTDFLLAPGNNAEFLFSTADGTIAGWNPLAEGQAPPSTHAVTLAKGAKGSAYTGLTSALINGKRYLYAANFTKGRVDVYDNAFHPVTLQKDGFDQDRLAPECVPFVDDRLPPNFVPFNVQAIGNDIVVTYVLHQEGEQFETDGPGLGFVDVYKSTGQLELRLEHGDWLNAPWGVALAPLDFGRFSHDLLIGQFAGGGTTESSGFVAAYDLATGKFDGLLQDASGKPIAINGIWAISAGNGSPGSYDPAAAPSCRTLFLCRA
jgi:uncharacterized protein (TIGR03118 family)